MHDKKYQVFISSTYEDLVKERRVVEETVIISGDFPVQMESFPATDKDQFEFIKTLIDRCDYYILIVAGRYGSIADDGLSYTEKEYRYAVEKGVPVLVMLHKERGGLRKDKSESTPEGQAKLESFIREISTGRMVKLWDDIASLQIGAMHALTHAKAVHPRPGWVRGDGVASVEVLEELRQARKEIDKYEDAIRKTALEIPLPAIPSHNEKIEFSILPVRKIHKNLEAASVLVACTWISIFPIFHHTISWSMHEWNDQGYYIDRENTCIAIGSAIANIISGLDTEGAYKITGGTLEKFIDYFIETGFMLTEGSDFPFPDHADRFARRQRIADPQNASVILVRGRVVEPPLHPAPNLDDDIPFYGVNS